MKELINLFLTFAKIGGFTFGGGYAMLPMLKKEVVESKHWATEEELLDYYVVGQCTPGVIAINTSTFIGYKIKGIFGGIAATLGMVFPSIVIITVIALFLKNFADIEIVKYAFAGIRVCVSVLIFDATVSIGRKSINSIFSAIIFAVIALISFFTDISAIILVISSAVAGIILSKFTEEKGGSKN